MRFSNVVALYLRQLRDRLGQELLALVGIAVGVALLFAALVANSSLTGSFERLTNGIVGDAQFQLSARGSSTISEGVLVQTQRIPGVERAAAILETRGEISGPRGEESVLLIGVTPEFGELGGSYTRGFSYGFLEDVRAMALPTPLVDRLGLSLGESADLTLDGRRVDGRVGAKLQGSDVGGLLESPVAIAPLRYAQELSRRPTRVSRVFVEPEPGRASEVEDALKTLAGDGVDVRPANFDAALFRQASLPTNQSTSMFSVFGAMVGFLFAFSAMLLTVPHRRRLIADLDEEGYGAGTILKFLFFDALVLGVVGSAVGIVLGDLAARQLFDEAPSFLQYAFAVGPERIVTVGNVVLAAAGGIVASCVAVLAPTVPALRQSASHEPWTARVTDPRWPGIVGLVFLAVGIAVVVLAPASAALGILGLAALTSSMLLLLPVLLRGLVELLAIATRQIRSVVPYLAIFALRDRAARARTLAVAATGAVAVFGSVALQGAHADLLRGLDRTSQDVAALGDVWAIAPGDANLLITTPFRAPSLPGDDVLERVQIYRGDFLDIGDRRVRVFGPPADGPQPLSDSQLVDGDARTVAQRLGAGGWIVLSEGVARELGVGVGDRVTLPSPVPTSFRVAATSTNMGWPPGAIVLNADDFARAWGSDAATAMLASVAPGVSSSEGREALRDALGPTSTLASFTAGEREAAQDDAAQAGVARLAQIAALVLVCAVIAMAAAMAGMIWQRRLFIASVKVEGYSTAELWKVITLEASVLIGAGCAIGAVFGLLGQGLLSRALTSVTGFPVIYSPAAVGAIVTCLAVTVAAVAIVAFFGFRAASIEPEVGLTE